MQWSEVQQNWKDLKPGFKTRWTMLQDADLTAIAGKREELIKHLQKHYKVEKAKLEQQVEEYIKTLKVGSK